MRAAFARAGGGIDGVTLRDVAAPAPGAGEALVRLTAATLNFRDLLVARGLVPGVREPEYVPLSDGAGIVEAVGASVTRAAPGHRVSPLFSQGWLTGPTTTMTMLGGPVDGTARTHAVFDAESLVRVPDTLGDMDAAALPCAGLTAWSALFGPRPLSSGEWVLVPGTGGVALCALQWAKAAGGRVVVTSSSDAKLARAKALGADIGVNYRTHPDWPAAVRAALGGGGIDIVVDTIGATELAAHARVVNPGGVIASMGRLGGQSSRGIATDAPLVPIMVGNREAHEAMLAFAAVHAIRPIVDAVYELDRLPDALRHLAGGRFFGKIGINLA